MQIDIVRAREIRTRFLTHPLTISIFVILILLYGWLDAGQTVPTASDLERILATLGGAVLYLGGFYIFLPHLLASNFAARIPFFWKISLLMTCLLITETVAVHFSLMRGADANWMLNYFLSSMFTGLVGVLAFCTFFRGAIERIFDEDPLKSIYGLKPRDLLDPLQETLPHEVRGDVLQLEAQTPYLLVTTTNGSALVRMTVKNAMQYVDAKAGWQVHRSRWVHKSRVMELCKRGKNHFFVDPDGNQFPISREMEPTLRAHLDLPI